MTQFNPPNPPTPPPPQFPVGYGYGYPAQPQRSNGAAVASLVLGLLGCVPFLTGLLAVIFGVVGIRKTRDPMVGGKGLAVAGLVLGILSMLGWFGCGGLFGFGYLQSRPAAAVAQQFLQDAAAGKTDAALANATGLTADQLDAQTAKWASFGALQSVSIWSFNYSAVNGVTTIKLGGVAYFANGPKACTFDLVKSGATYKVTGFTVQ